MTSFKAWLKTQTQRDTPVGDIARDASADPRWPRGNARLGTLIEHLESNGASPAAFEALRDAYGEWCGPTVTGWLKWERETGKPTEPCHGPGSTSLSSGPPLTESQR